MATGAGRVPTLQSTPSSSTELPPEGAPPEGAPPAAGPPAAPGAPPLGRLPAEPAMLGPPATFGAPATPGAPPLVAGAPAPPALPAVDGDPALPGAPPSVAEQAKTSGARAANAIRAAWENRRTIADLVTRKVPSRLQKNATRKLSRKSVTSRDELRAATTSLAGVPSWSVPRLPHLQCFMEVWLGCGSMPPLRTRISCRT